MITRSENISTPRLAMKVLKQLCTISLWELKNAKSILNVKTLPVLIPLLFLLAFLSATALSSGVHLQDGVYELAITDQAYAEIVVDDPRFTVYYVPDIHPDTIRSNAFDVAIINGILYTAPTPRGSGARTAIRGDYEYYSEGVYLYQSDIFAAFPLWINAAYIDSPLDFTATSQGMSVAAPRRPIESVLPDNPVAYVEPPAQLTEAEKRQLRQQLLDSRLTQNLFGIDTLSPAGENPYDIPSRLSPPLPFDAIIFVFVFVFPLYFMSQFYMMSIMNERTLRQGEILLSAPLHPSAIILGKMLPYGIGMALLAAAIIFSREGNIEMFYPLIPIILFFLAAALFIGMTARSYRELSFISIFFSTVATSYLFFPTIFAHVHVVGLLSPVTLVIFALEGSGYTLNEYLYSTALFYLISIILIVLSIKNYREEFLFSQRRLLDRWIDAISAFVHKKHPLISISAITVCTVPFIFMAEMLVLVLFFNLPMPLSLLLIMSSVAFIEEIGKSIGLLALYNIDEQFFTWKRLIFASCAVGLGFLIGEKSLLFVSLPQISDSIFGIAMFLTLGLLILPFLLHSVTALITVLSLKLGGRRAYPLGIILATIVHLLYNWYVLSGWFS
jgi:ABC-type Na+ efflux pump permease subunit